MLPCPWPGLCQLAEAAVDMCRGGSVQAQQHTVRRLKCTDTPGTGHSAAYQALLHTERMRSPPALSTVPAQDKGSAVPWDLS